MLKTEKFKVRLTEDKTRLEGLIAYRHANAGVGAGGEVSAMSLKDSIADGATNTFTQELDLAVLQKYRDRLLAVNLALTRLDEGVYGICVRCHLKISTARLEAIPETPFCRDCETDVEVQA